MRIGDYTRLKQRQISVVSAVQGKLTDSLFPYQVTQLRSLGVNQSLTAVYSHVGRDANDLHHQGDGSCIVDRESDVGENERFETGRFGSQFIEADWQPRKNEPSFIFARSNSHKSRFEICGRHF